MQDPDTMFKLFGPLSIAVVWVGLLFVVYKWRGNPSMSFSQHAAQTKAGQWFYVFLFALVLPLLYLFFVEWFAPTFHLPNSFRYIVTIGILGQILAVAVPAVPGRKEQIHNIGAYLMAFTMLPSSIIIALADINTITTITALATALYMIGASCIAFTVKRAHNYYLYFQTAYIALFHLTLLVATFSA